MVFENGGSCRNGRTPVILGGHNCHNKGPGWCENMRTVFQNNLRTRDVFVLKDGISVCVCMKTEIISNQSWQILLRFHNKICKNS